MTRKPAVGVWASAVMATVLVAVTAASAAGTATTANVYEPFSVTGSPQVRVTQTVRGHCWTGSLASPRRDAWRCLSGNFIYDPCFQLDSGAGYRAVSVVGPMVARRDQAGIDLKASGCRWKQAEPVDGWPALGVADSIGMEVQA